MKKNYIFPIVGTALLFLYGIVGIIILIQPSQSSSEQNAITDTIKHLSGYMGLYLIISSISLFVFLTVISNIAENTVAIRMNSEKLVQKEII
ncbi:hypothetical protein KPL37_15610 [Clostridium frigoris]|uniref:Uncharacterized protein n=1 Tax=Clostridium frigoris TaxID=205327 RepID=A0ABS6BW57_9CLOT|nr:hypothetical protein [Clostridium frigoris]MBU3161147.1 hypothetical protein [Clostridium frigoris]